MARVELTHDTVVRFKAGTVLEVSDEEAARLKAFGNARAVVEAAPEAPKPVAKSKKSTKKRA